MLWNVNNIPSIICKEIKVFQCSKISWCIKGYTKTKTKKYHAKLKSNCKRKKKEEEKIQQQKMKSVLLFVDNYVCILFDLIFDLMVI